MNIFTLLNVSLVSDTGVPGAVLHQQQTTGSAGTGEVQEGQISWMPLTVPHREPMLTSQ